MKQLLRLVLILFGVVSFCTWVSWHMGYTGLLIIPVDINLTRPVQFGLESLLYAIHMTLLFGYVLDVYSHKLTYVVIPYVILTAILMWWIPSSLLLNICMLLYIFGASLALRDFKKSSIRLLISGGIIIAHNLLSMMGRFGTYNQMELSLSQALVGSVDLIVISVSIFCIGGIKHVDKACERLLFPESIRNPRLDREDLRSISTFTARRGFARVASMALLACFNLAQWAIILGICNMFGGLIEGLLLTASFIVLGTVVQRRWHSHSLVICTLASSALFLVAVRVLPSFHNSQFLPVVTALLLLYGLYRLDILVAKSQITNEKLVDELKNRGYTSTEAILAVRRYENVRMVPDEAQPGSDTTD